jgi:ribosome-binding protein aMBF1 (putative translation factor)
MATGTRETYAEWLEKQMQERGLSRRALAKIWRPDDIESARRSIRRYLGGMFPQERVRREIADALGVAELGPAGADDAEED